MTFRPQGISPAAFEVLRRRHGVVVSIVRRVNHLPVRVTHVILLNDERRVLGLLAAIILLEVCNDA